MNRFAVPLVWTLVCSAPAHAADWKSALTKPLSPGSVALLVEHAREPGVRERWTAALGDQQAEVRAAAARVIHTSGAAWLLPDLVAALAKEADVNVAIEELRAIGSLGNSSTDGALLAAGRRMGPPVVDVAADALGRMRGADALGHLALLRSAGLSSAGYSHLASTLARSGSEGVTRLAQAALRESDPQAWEAALREGRQARYTIDATLMKSALGMDAPRFRTLTYWHLAREVDHGANLPSDVLSALASTPEAMGHDPGDPDAQFAFEMLQRVQGRNPGEVSGWLAARARRAPPVVPFPSAFDDPLVRRLAPAERKVLDLTKDDEARFHSRPSGPAPESPLRMSIPFPPGFAPDLIAVSGCKPRPDDVAVARFTYGPGGRPRHVALAESGLAPKCLEAGRALLLSVLASPGEPTPSETIVVPMALDVLTCGEEKVHSAGSTSGSSSEELVPVGGRIQPPKKIVNVPPIYPEGARQARVEGMVILEAVISPSGCVVEAKVLQSIPLLNAAAMRAVMRWRYTPTLLDGRPVPVIMTVTVNFRLSS